MLMITLEELQRSMTKPGEAVDLTAINLYSLHNWPLLKSGKKWPLLKSESHCHKSHKNVSRFTNLLKTNTKIKGK